MVEKDALGTGLGTVATGGQRYITAALVQSTAATCGQRAQQLVDILCG